MQHPRTLRSLSLVLLTAAFGACGGDKPPVTEPTIQPPPPPPPPPPPTASASVEAPPAPSAVASAEPTVHKPSGRPAILMSNDKEISGPFGTSPGAVLRLKMGADGEATLKIPEWSLHGGTNISWKFEKITKGKGTILGRPCSVTPTDPSSPTIKVMPLDSAGAPFELRFPTFGKESVNLAVGEITGEDGKTKIEWKVLAPKSVSDGVAVFEVTHLGQSYVHATLSDPTP